jgi:hypothetical protein
MAKSVKLVSKAVICITNASIIALNFAGVNGIAKNDRFRRINNYNQLK